MRFTAIQVRSRVENTNPPVRLLNGKFGKNKKSLEYLYTSSESLTTSYAAPLRQKQQLLPF